MTNDLWYIWGRISALKQKFMRGIFDLMFTGGENRGTNLLFDNNEEEK